MITKDDLSKYKAFKTLVNKSKIEMQGDAVLLAASLMQWFNELENKLVYSKDMFEMQNMKEKKESIKDK